MKFSTIAALAISASSVLATPPACLLACVSKIEKNSECSGLNDLKCICSAKGDDIEQCLDQTCPNGDADSAKKAFESACKEQGHEVDAAAKSKSSSKSSSSSSKSFSSSSAAPSTKSSASSAAPSTSSSAAKTTESSTQATSSKASSTKAPASTTSSAKSATSASSSHTVSSFSAGGNYQAASFGAAVFGVIGALL